MQNDLKHLQALHWQPGSFSHKIKQLEKKWELEKAQLNSSCIVIQKFYIPLFSKSLELSFEVSIHTKTFHIKRIFQLQRCSHAKHI